MSCNFEKIIIITISFFLLIITRGIVKNYYKSKEIILIVSTAFKGTHSQTSSLWKSFKLHDPLYSQIIEAISIAFWLSALLTLLNKLNARFLLLNPWKKKKLMRPASRKLFWKLWTVIFLIQQRNYFTNPLLSLLSNLSREVR